MNLRRSPRLILPREGCRQNWDIWQEPVSNFDRRSPCKRGRHSQVAPPRFDRPHLTCIRGDRKPAHTKIHPEMVVRSGSSFREIVHQHWNFSSPDVTRESEQYNVDLSNVTLFDLTIDPDKGNGEAQGLTLEFAFSLTSCHRRFSAKSERRSGQRDVRIRCYHCQTC